MIITLNKYRYAILLTIIVCLFFIIKQQGLVPMLSDENTYFLMAKMLSRGSIPYKDFFLANPPVQIITIMLVGIFSNFSIYILKLIPVFSHIIAAIAIFFFMKDEFENELSGIIASVFYLFSSAVLLTSDHGTGVHLTMCFMALSLVFARKYSLIAGIFATFSTFTRIYGIVGVFSIFLWLFLEKRSSSYKYLISFITTSIVTSIILYAITNGAFVDQVFLFRLNLVNQVGIPLTKILEFFIKWDFGLILLGLSGVYILTKKHIFLPIIYLSSYLLFFAIYNDRYYLYSVTLVLPLSIAGGYICHEMWKKCDEFIKLIIPIIPLIYFGFIITNYSNNHAPVSKISNLDEMVVEIEDNMTESSTLYGSFDIAPLISLITDKPLINNIADLNDKNYINNIYSAEEMTTNATNNGLIIFSTFIINKEATSISSAIDLEQLADHCILLHSYPIERDYSKNAIVVYDCLRVNEQ